jgi:hypothetical protein
MKEKTHDIALHDIKSIVDIQDYSFYYFLGLVGFCIVVLFGILYLLYKWYKKTKTFNVRKYNAELLFALDLKDTKKSAYAITNYGDIFKNDSPRHIEIFSNLNGRLEEYKYKKSVNSFDDETLGYIELYKGMIDV